MQQFVDTNISGTLALLEEAVRQEVRAFVFTSTTSTFGDALRPAPGTPAAWITESVLPIPKNIYGSTKVAAEDLCHLVHRKDGLNCIVLRTSRFFPEEDDDAAKRAAFSGDNAKANEFLYRRVEIADVVSAHLCAAARAADLGFGRYIISATTPFRPEDVDELNRDAPSVVRRRISHYATVYERLGWTMFPHIDRVYDNSAAVRDLKWQPTYHFEYVLQHLDAGSLPRSALAIAVGSKGYHDVIFDDGPFPV